jgi:rare lipoprotein A
MRALGGVMLALLSAAAMAQEPPAGAGPRGTSQEFGKDRYDAVGYASWYGEESGQLMANGQRFDPQAVVAAHASLPLGSFAEVTALDTGKTILVLVTDRGPGAPGRLIDLSRGAAKLLGVDSNPLAPVRVRRVDPPPADQAALRAGKPASPRLDAPAALLAALRKQLPTAPRPVIPASAKPVPVSPRRPVAQAAPAPAPAGQGLFVQVAALSSKARAQALAERLGGGVQAVGPVFRVRLGPFASRAAADAARARAAAAGYGDARLVQE